MKYFVYLWVHSGVQPELLVADSNHRFVNGDLPRNFTVKWPEIAVLSQSWVDFRLRWISKQSKINTVYIDDS